MTDQTQTTTEPVACPFCGSRAHIDNERGLWTVGCFKDACTQGGTWFHAETREEAIAAWNKRTTPQPLASGLNREAVATIRAALDSKAGIVDLRDFSEELMTILALAAPAEGWQPIETAPKDGTWVLVCMTHNLSCCEWETLQWVDCWAPNFQWPIYRDRIDIPFPPTHWMPLPAAPTGGRS